MTSGGDRTSTTPPPPPPSTTQGVADAEAMLEPAPDADEAAVTFDAVGDAMIRLAIWVIW